MPLERAQRREDLLPSATPVRAMECAGALLVPHANRGQHRLVARRRAYRLGPRANGVSTRRGPGASLPPLRGFAPIGGYVSGTRPGVRPSKSAHWKGGYAARPIFFAAGAALGEARELVRANWGSTSRS